MEKKYCWKCGQENTLDATFCEACGVNLNEQESEVEEKKDVTKPSFDFKAFLSGKGKFAVLGVLVAAIVLVASQFLGKVEMKDYFLVGMEEGYNGVGEVAYYYYDIDRLALAVFGEPPEYQTIDDLAKYQEYYQKVAELQDAIVIEWPEDIDSYKSNGDKLTFKVSLEKDYKNSKLKPGTYTYTVSGLQEPQKAVPEDIFDFEVKGYNNEGDLNVSAKNWYLSNYYSYSVTGGEDGSLKNGDKLSILITFDEDNYEYALNYMRKTGYEMDRVTTYEYEVSGLKERVALSGEPTLTDGVYTYTVLAYEDYTYEVPMTVKVYINDTNKTVYAHVDVTDDYPKDSYGKYLVTGNTYNSTLKSFYNQILNPESPLPIDDIENLGATFYYATNTSAAIVNSVRAAVNDYNAG